MNLNGVMLNKRTEDLVTKLNKKIRLDIVATEVAR